MVTLLQPSYPLYLSDTSLPVAFATGRESWNSLFFLLKIEGGADAEAE
jgi:hypothetical protein